MATSPKCADSHITKDAEVCGGRVTIDGTRIRVLDIRSLKQRGLATEAQPARRIGRGSSRIRAVARWRSTAL